MAVFEYAGLTAKGAKTKGIIDADSARSAREKLRGQGIFPSSLVESSKAESSAVKKRSITIGGGVNVNDLAVATRQLATFVSAGLPLVEALSSLKEQLDHDQLKRVFSEVRDRVNEGSNFAEALRKFPKIFPPLYANMVAAGEASGSLDLVLERLSDLLESQAELKRKLMSASLYPVMMILLCFGIIVLLLNYVVPEIAKIFKDQKKELPLPTRIVVAASEFSQSYWWVIIVAIVALIFGFKKYYQSKSGRLVIDRLKLSMPILGSMNVKIATSRMSRTMGTLLSSGVNILNALNIVKNIIGNAVLVKALEDAAIGVREGKSLSSELKKCEFFPPLLINLVRVGEKTGEMPEMFTRVAKAYDSQIDAIVSGFTKILEPVLILFIAVVVGGTMAAVMLPMIEMSNMAM